jgi:hypothetical protein
MMECKGRQHSGPPRIPNYCGVVDSNGSIRMDDENHSDFWLEITLTAEEIARLRPRDAQDDTADGN